MALVQYRALCLLVFLRADRRCEWCGRRGGCDIDHVVKRSAGGPDHWSNLIALCRACHDRKDFGTYARGKLTIRPLGDGRFEGVLLGGTKAAPVPMGPARVFGRAPSAEERIQLAALDAP